MRVKINENDPCTEYWPEIEWVCHDYLLMEVESCENCHIIVEFCNRETTPGRGEYQITGIYGTSSCLLCPEADIYQAAYVKLLLVDPYGYTDDEQAQIVQQSACIDIYEDEDPILEFFVQIPSGDLLNPAALSNYVYSVDSLGNYIIEVDFGFLPCGTVCCHMQYFIDKDPITGETIGITHNLEGTPDWPDCENHPSCQPNCEVLEFDWSSSGKGTVLEKYKDISSGNIFIFPNPNEGTFRVKVDNNSLKVSKIELFSIDGILIYSKILEDGSDVFEQNISIEKIINGIILYNIYDENNNLKSGKVIIQK